MWETSLRALEGLQGSWGQRRAGPGAQPLGWEMGKKVLTLPLLWLRFYHKLHLNWDTVGWSPLDWLLREGTHVVRNTSRDTTSREFLTSAHSHLAPGWRKKGIPGEVCTHPFL